MQASIDRDRKERKMSTSGMTRAGARFASLLAIVAIPLAVASPAAAASKPAPKTKKPQASTGAATHILNSSALLNASINPNGMQTSYYFQWGPTTSYGSQTPTVVVGDATTRVKVGQLVSGLETGVTYHYRVVAVTSSGEPIPGHDRTFVTGKSTPKLELPKSADVIVGTPFALSGTLTGPDNAHQTVELQASTYPYREEFRTVGVSTFTGPTGAFSFAVAPISASTEYRAITVGLRPLFSRIETVHAQVKVALRVRTSQKRGLVRLYGTVAPATVGATVALQVHEAVKPGSVRPGSEVTARWVNQFVTVVKKAGKTFSRFSVVVNVHVGGRYRAVVKLRNGPLASGYSPTLVLRAALTPTKKAKRKKTS
jgi:hypothetical protein